MNRVCTEENVLQIGLNLPVSTVAQEVKVWLLPDNNQILQVWSFLVYNADNEAM